MKRTYLTMMILAGSSLLAMSVKTFAFSSSEVRCMAETMYGEDNRPNGGWASVGGTVMTRYYSGRYPKNVCAIVHQVWKGQRQFAPKSLASMPSSMRSQILAAAKLALKKRGNGFLGFRSYCGKGKGGKRIAGEGGNCFRRSADSSFDRPFTPPAQRSETASDRPFEILPSAAGADAAI